MTNRLLFVITCAVFFFCLMQVSLAQKPGEESGLFIEENILYEKGKMTFMKFNSGKWFNAELSLYLMDSYPFVLNSDQQIKEE